MASACQTRRFVVTICRSYNSCKSLRNISTSNIHRTNRSLTLFAASAAVVTATSIYLWKKYALNINHYAASAPQNNNKPAKNQNENAEVKLKSTHGSQREARFRQFASIEHEGNIYMSPQDFLESVTEVSPRPRIGRVNISREDSDALLRITPTQEHGSPRLFREILDKGIISYTEYLFLLCVLTKPRSGFQIAFNMFDLDGNRIVDMREFLVLQMVLGANRKSLRRLTPDMFDLRPMEEVLKDPDEIVTLPRRRKLKDKWIFGNLLESVLSSVAERNSTEPCGLQNMDGEGNMVRTTLLVHFFGLDGKRVLNYERFERFMENLQTEILELEFKGYAKGMPTITEVEFSRILLRYTVLNSADIEKCIGRVEQRMENEKGITFKEFKQFCTFLNNLDDFAIAMKFYSIAAQPVSQDEFQRAVKVCTGEPLHPHIVDTVFHLFDEDGDGHLSHKEFIFIMKDRLHRGSKSHLMSHHSHVENFKHCVKSEMTLNR